MTNPTPPTREELVVASDPTCDCTGCSAGRTLLAVMDACTPERMMQIAVAADTLDEVRPVAADNMNQLLADLRNALDIGDSGG